MKMMRGMVTFYKVHNFLEKFYMPYLKQNSYITLLLFIKIFHTVKLKNTIILKNYN